MTTSAQDGNTPLSREEAPAPAIDAVGRSRQVSVYSRDGEVVLRVPPGEVAILRPDKARELAGRLSEQAEASQASATVLPFRAKASPNRPRTGSGT